MKITVGTFSFETKNVSDSHNLKLLKMQFDHDLKMKELEKNNSGVTYNYCTFGTPMIVPMNIQGGSQPSAERAIEYLVTTLGMNNELASRVVEALSQFYSDKSK